MSRFWGNWALIRRTGMRPLVKAKKVCYVAARRFEEEI